MIEYFSRETVEDAVLNYFMAHGCNEAVRDQLMDMEANRPEMFFDMVSSFVEKRYASNRD